MSNSLNKSPLPSLAMELRTLACPNLHRTLAFRPFGSWPTSAMRACAPRTARAAGGASCRSSSVFQARYLLSLWCRRAASALMALIFQRSSRNRRFCLDGNSRYDPRSFSLSRPLRSRSRVLVSAEHLNVRQPSMITQTILRARSSDEPGAGIPHAGISEGAIGKPVVLP